MGEGGQEERRCMTDRYPSPPRNAIRGLPPLAIPSLVSFEVENEGRLVLEAMEFLE